MKPSNYLFIFLIGIMVGYASHFPIVGDDSRMPDTSKWVEPTPAPILEPTPSQEEINERVTKALRLNPPL